MKKKCQVIMIPTEKPTEIGSYGIWLNSAFNIRPYWSAGVMTCKPVNMSCKSHHMYILSDDEIKEGDWIYSGDENKVYKFTSSMNYLNLDKKIIATTDTSLIAKENICDGCEEVGVMGESFCEGCCYNTKQILPRPSDSFIQKYCEANGISEVIVEYEAFHGIKTCISEIRARENNDLDWSTHWVLEDYRPKVFKDNTINILEAKSSWSREEVIEFAQKYARMVTERNILNGYKAGHNRQWIEENL